MAELAADTFDRADNADLGAAWDVPTGRTRCGIVSNAVEASASDADCEEAYNGVTWPNDQYSEVTLSSIAAAARPGPAARMDTGNGNVYAVETSPTEIRLWKYFSGSWSNPATYSGSMSSTDVIRIEVQSTTIRILQNGVQRISTTDSSISSGRAGLHVYLDPGTPLNNARIASWRGGDFVTATERHQTRRMRQAGGYH